MKIKQIGCVGAGYVGGLTCSVIAFFNPEIMVYVYDINKERIKEWNSDVLPMYEPGLEEIVAKSRGRNLFFTTDYEKAVVESDLVFLCVNTPTKNYGIGKGKASDFRHLEICGRNIREKFTKGKKIIVIKSTVPVKASQVLKKILETKNENDVQFDVLSNHSFISEGRAISELKNPDRICIGGDNEEALQALVSVYSWIPKEKIITTSLCSSELGKLVGNAFLAQRISSINAVSALCEKVGGDVSEVSKIIGKDSRIGSKFLEASIGFGGSCFQKDIFNLCYLCEMNNLPEVAEYFYQIVKMNDYQKNRFSRKIIETMFGCVQNKKIVLLGFAFKKDTSDTRESPSIYIGRDLLNERAKIVIHDPKVHESDAKSCLKRIMNHCYMADSLDNEEVDSKIVDENVTFEKDVYKACENASAIVVLTEWDCFKDYDYKKLYKIMDTPSFIFDGRNLLKKEELEDIGFEYYCVGKGK